MTTALVTLTSKLAARLDIGDGAGLIETLKATAFKGQVSDAQMTALMIVANQYGLNPWTKEIYAFPDKQNGIVPVVGVDGWARIINTHPQFDGMDFKADAESCTCTIYRKDRSHPVSVTEYMEECYRPPIKKDGYEIKTPWQTHARRMLRHKSMIQCARLAFGFVGIFEQDEAERILEAGAPTAGPAPLVERVEPAAYPQADFDKNLPAWRKLIEAGKKTPDAIIAMVESKAPLSDDQKSTIRAVTPKKSAAPQATYAQVMDALVSATTIDALDVACGLIGSVVGDDFRTELTARADAIRAEIMGEENANA